MTTPANDAAEPQGEDSPAFVISTYALGLLMKIGSMGAPEHAAEVGALTVRCFHAIQAISTAPGASAAAAAAAEAAAYAQGWEAGQEALSRRLTGADEDVTPRGDILH